MSYLVGLLCMYVCNDELAPTWRSYLGNTIFQSSFLQDYESRKAQWYHIIVTFTINESEIFFY